MLTFSFNGEKLTPGIDSKDFYCPLLSGTVEKASIRVVTGGSWDLHTLTEAIKSENPHAFLCCLVELIPETGNESSVFPKETCLLSIASKDVMESPADHSVLFSSEGLRRLYGCRPGQTHLRVGDKQIVNEDGKLKLVKAPALADEISDPYHQYRGQNIAVLELL